MFFMVPEATEVLHSVQVSLVVETAGVPLAVD